MNPNMEFTSEMSWQIHAVRGPGADADVVRDLHGLLVDCEDIYPGIEVWLARKALPGIQDGSRCGFVVYQGSTAIAAAMVKLVGDLKLCSLRVLPSHQERGIGTALFHSAARMIVQVGDQFHFTAPERLVTERASFFEALGFSARGKMGLRYRPGESEWLYSAQTTDVIARTEQHATPGLFGIQYRADAVLMSLYPRHAHAILKGLKTIELRRGFCEAARGATIFLYASAPEQRVLGTASIRSVQRLPIEQLVPIMTLAHCSQQELREYAGPHESLYAIELENVREFETPFDRREAERRLGVELPAPQAPRRLAASDPWMTALADFAARQGEIGLLSQAVSPRAVPKASAPDPEI